MELDIRLSNGTLVGPPDLSIWNRSLRFTAQRRRDCAFAWEHCKPSKGYSIVLAKNGRVLASVTDLTDLEDACDTASEKLTACYSSKKWLLPDSGVVAVVRPFPEGSLVLLAACGVDTVFAPERLRGAKASEQDTYINRWLGRYLSRPFEEDRRIFVVEPFRRKQ